VQGGGLLAADHLTCGLMDLSDVTVVVTSHDAGDTLVETVRPVRDAGNVASIHVVDSGSTDGSVDALERAFTDIRVTRLGENRGPCATRNLGLEEATTEFVLFIDDDMRLEEGCIESLRTALRSDPAIAMAGPRILADGDGGVQYEGGRWHFAGLTHMRMPAADQTEEGVVDVDVLTSGCLLVRRDPVAMAEGFDESLFFLMEDVDLSLRLRYLGHRLVAVPGARAWNTGGSEGLSLRGAAYPRQRMRLHSRNRFLLVLGLYDFWTLLVLLPGLILMDLAWLAFSVLGGHPGAFIRGKVEVLIALPSIRKKRRRIVGRKVVRDAQLCGAPPLTLTATARAQPLVSGLSHALDGMLRILWNLSRGLLQ